MKTRARTRDSRFYTKAERDVSNPEVRAWLSRIFVKPLILNFREPIVLVLNTYLALVYALLFAALESYRVVFVDIYGFSSGQEGLTFIAGYIGFAISQLIYSIWYWKYQAPEFNEEGKMKPERRIIPAFFAAFTIPVGLFWYGWSAEARLHPAMAIIGGTTLHLRRSIFSG